MCVKKEKTFITAIYDYCVHMYTNVCVCMRSYSREDSDK